MPNESTDAPRAGGETPTLRPCPFCGNDAAEETIIDKNEGVAYTPWYQAVCRRCDFWLPGSRDEAEAIAQWNQRASLLERHRDGERERLPAPSEIADLPAMTPIANVIRRSAYYVLNYHGATFASEKDAAGVAGHIAVSVTMANGFEDALHAAVLAGPSPERASK